jgi:effector-binding domain-containing protein
MPVASVKAVMDAPSTTERNALIAQHLERLDSELERTRAAVESLRALLRGPAVDRKISRRSVPEVWALAIKATIDRTNLGAWWHGAISELHATLRARHLLALGPLCGIYDAELFQNDHGEALVYVPVGSEQFLSAAGRVFATRVPSGEFAIIAHAGPLDDLDVTCGQLAEHVAAHELGIGGPIREFYLRDPVEHPNSADWVMEIGWPIFRADSDEG